MVVDMLVSGGTVKPAAAGSAAGPEDSDSSHGSSGGPLDELAGG